MDRGEIPISRANPERVLVHTPFGRDAALICQVLEKAGINAAGCPTPEALCAELKNDTGAAIISEESLTAASVTALAEVLHTQPPWSDLPLIITTTGGEATEASRRRLDLLQPLGNVTLLERPLRIATLVSSVRAALRARYRQYQLRDNFAERERLVQDLVRSNDELAQFAHIVSHDLQAPLRMVKTYSQLLARNYSGRLDATADEFIGTITDGATMMDVLIRTLLNYATVGRGPLNPEKVELVKIVEAVLATLKPSIEEAGAEVTYSDLPMIYGDQVLLHQLVQNLVDNALKYRGGAAKPHIQISAERTQGDWAISVKDNGPGIAPADHERIFLPLKRLHGNEVPGTGMGLAVCRKIIERHGGRMWVQSAVGNGAAFYFTLAEGMRLQPEHVLTMAPLK